MSRAAGCGDKKVQTFHRVGSIVLLELLRQPAATTRATLTTHNAMTGQENERTMLSTCMRPTSTAEAKASCTSAVSQVAHLMYCGGACTHVASAGAKAMKQIVAFTARAIEMTNPRFMEF
jgi:hypothetical protein